MRQAKRMILSCIFTLGLLLGLGMVVQAATFTTLREGDVIRIGDTIAPVKEQIDWCNSLISDEYIDYVGIGEEATLTRVDHDMDADPNDEYYHTKCEEHPGSGKYYGFRYKDSAEGFICNTWFEVTAPSDGLIVTKTEAFSFQGRSILRVYFGLHAKNAETIQGKTLTNLKVGDVIHLGDTIAPVNSKKPFEYYNTDFDVNKDYPIGGIGINEKATLIRVNQKDGSTEPFYCYEDPEKGQEYGFRFDNGQTWNIFLKVSDNYDGLVVTDIFDRVTVSKSTGEKIPTYGVVFGLHSKNVVTPEKTVPDNTSSDKAAEDKAAAEKAAAEKAAAEKAAAEKAAAEKAAADKAAAEKAAADKAAAEKAAAEKAAQEKVTIPKAPAGVKAKGKKAKAIVSWKKIKKTKAGKKLLAQINYIQVQYATDPAFTQNVGTREVAKNKTKATLNLERKTVYYVRVRYVGTDGVSNWSKVKKVKTK